MMKIKSIQIGYTLALLLFSETTFAAEEFCISCHRNISPAQIAIWESSRHSQKNVTCSDCHGNKHKKAEDADLA